MRLSNLWPFTKKETPELQPEIDIYELDQDLEGRCTYLGALIKIGESGKAGYRPIWEDETRTDEQMQAMKELEQRNKDRLLEMEEIIYSLPEKMKRQYLAPGETETDWVEAPIGKTLKAILTDYEREMEDHTVGTPKTMDTEFFFRNAGIIVSEGLIASTNRKTFEEVCVRYLEERTRHKKFQAAARLALTFRAFVQDSIDAETEDRRNESRATAQKIAEAVKILVNTGHIPPK